MNKTLIALLFSALSLSASADDVALKKQMEQFGASNVQIVDSPIHGFRTVLSDQGVLQITADGRFILQGEVLEVKNGKAVNITHQALLAQLNAQQDQMIIYPAKNEKYVINVFMDTSCYYCQMLHSKIKEYNDLGITIRYLAFPRQGLNSQIASQMEAIWTAKDRQFALNEAEKGNLPKTLKTPNIVKQQFELGQKFGVSGTPNIITSSGEIIAGFVEPQALVKMLAP